MTTLTEFLLERIAEDEEAAYYAMTRDPLGDRDTEGWWIGHYQHYTRHDPERVVDECRAKRRIVDRFATVAAGEGETTQLAFHEQGLFEAVTFLAAVWGDHPDYRSEWLP